MTSDNHRIKNLEQQIGHLEELVVDLARLRIPDYVSSSEVQAAGDKYYRARGD